jgi:hypothetical protein
MFCTGTRGWLISPGPGMDERFAAALREGATVVVTPRTAAHALPDTILATRPLADSADLAAFRVPRDSTAAMTGHGDPPETSR